MESLHKMQYIKTLKRLIYKAFRGFLYLSTFVKWCKITYYFGALFGASGATFGATFKEI
jgi:hypothetical protein